MRSSRRRSSIPVWRSAIRVRLRSWSPPIYAPGGYHTLTRLNAIVDIGGYRSPRSPDEPTLLWMVEDAVQTRPARARAEPAGRAELLATTFEDFERNIRDQLGRMLGAGGFDPAADITAITVNRWPHGYAPEHNSLLEPDVPEAEQPHVIGRARFGRIAIANSDSGGGAYTDVAIEQAHRAVQNCSQARRGCDAADRSRSAEAERYARALLLCGDA